MVPSEDTKCTINHSINTYKYTISTITQRKIKVGKNPSRMGNISLKDFSRHFEAMEHVKWDTEISFVSYTGHKCS